MLEQVGLRGSVFAWLPLLAALTVSVPGSATTFIDIELVEHPPKASLTPLQESASVSLQPVPDRRLGAAVLTSGANRFRPPLGIAGHRWGDSLAQVAEGHYLRFAFKREVNDRDAPMYYRDRCPGSPNASDYECLSQTPTYQGPLDPERVHHLMFVEYKLRDVSLFLPEAGVVFDRVAYQFAATSLGDRAAQQRYAHPATLKSALTFVGARLMFSRASQVPPEPFFAWRLDEPEPTPENLVELPGTGAPRRILNTLIHTLGPTAPQPKQPHRGFNRIEHYTWCEDVVGDVQINCIVEVIYAYDKATGNGFVDFATPTVFAYLDGRRARLERGMSLEPVDLYFLLLPRNPPVRLAHAGRIISEEFEPDDSIKPEERKAYDLTPSGTQSQ